MGCGGSKEKAETSGRASGATSPRRRNPEGHKGDVMGNPHKTWEATNWENDMRDIWARTLDNLPVHMDIPRLGYKMVIYGPAGEVITDGHDRAVPKQEVVHSLLLMLTRHLHDSKEFQENVDAKYWEFVEKDGSGDVSQQLLRYLVDVVGDDSHLGRVLKCCHQKIIFPGFYCLKNKIYDEVPFKDLRGTWQVFISLEGGKVVVAHRKTQVSKAFFEEDSSQEEATPEFTFDWELSLHFDEDVREMKEICISILKVNVSDWVDPARKQEIFDVFAKHYTVGESRLHMAKGRSGSGGGSDDNNNGAVVVAESDNDDEKDNDSSSSESSSAPPSESSVSPSESPSESSDDDSEPTASPRSSESE